LFVQHGHEAVILLFFSNITPITSPQMGSPGAQKSLAPSPGKKIIRRRRQVSGDTKWDWSRIRRGIGFLCCSWLQRDPRSFSGCLLNNSQI
jgi:hypothetical protein